MKKLISTISLIISCISIVSCGSSPSDTVKEDGNNTVKQTQTETSPVAVRETDDKQESSPEAEIETQEEEDNQNKEENEQVASKNLDSQKNTRKGASKQPTVGTVTKLVNGDLLCYVTLVDKKGIEHNVGATFEICAEEEKFLNKKVRAVYEIESVSDCESAEPCGKSRKESIITKMELVSKDSQKKPSITNSKSSDSQTLSNGEWTITLSNTDSWKGVNGTGDVNYKGCDAQGKCITLTGGKISCRDGKCVTGWKNGDYVYILEQPITEDGNATTSLTVRKKATEVLKATGFKVVSDN